MHKNNASAQQQISITREKIETELRAAPRNSFAPIWTQTIPEIRATPYLGESLLERIDSIFNRNQITPVVAGTELREIVADSERLSSKIESLLQSFEARREELPLTGFALLDSRAEYQSFAASTLPDGLRSRPISPRTAANTNPGSMSALIRVCAAIHGATLLPPTR